MKEKVIGFSMFLLGIAILLAFLYQPKNETKLAQETSRVQSLNTRQQQKKPSESKTLSTLSSHLTTNTSVSVTEMGVIFQSAPTSTIPSSPSTVSHQEVMLHPTTPSLKTSTVTQTNATLPPPLLPVPKTVPAIPVKEFPTAALENEPHVQVVNVGPTTAKQVALTFDDGPHPIITLKVLDILREYNAKATFFVIGSRAKRYPWILRQIVAEGHEIGNHTYTHLMMTAETSTDEVIDREITQTQNEIKNAIGYETFLFRPPYGTYRAETKSVFRDHNLNIVLWSVDSNDWRAKEHDRIFQTVTNHIHNGSIILCHDIHKAILDSLPHILDTLKAEGYEFTTISHLCSLPAMRLVKTNESLQVPSN